MRLQQCMLQTDTVSPPNFSAWEGATHSSSVEIAEELEDCDVHWPRFVFPQLQSCCLKTYLLRKGNHLFERWKILGGCCIRKIQGGRKSNWTICCQKQVREELVQICEKAMGTICSSIHASHHIRAGPICGQNVRKAEIYISRDI